MAFFSQCSFNIDFRTFQEVHHKVPRNIVCMIDRFLRRPILPASFHPSLWRQRCLLSSPTLLGVSIAYEIQQQTIVKWNIILKIQKFHYTRLNYFRGTFRRVYSISTINFSKEMYINLYLCSACCWPWFVIVVWLYNNIGAWSWHVVPQKQVYMIGLATKKLFIWPTYPSEQGL